jgi:hypothetical protein
MLRPSVVRHNPGEDRSELVNPAWHKRHPMPKNATLEQRIRWHHAHAKACGCRALPATVRKANAAQRRAR